MVFHLKGILQVSYEEIRGKKRIDEFNSKNHKTLTKRVTIVKVHLKLHSEDFKILGARFKPDGGKHC